MLRKVYPFSLLVLMTACNTTQPPPDPMNPTTAPACVRQDVPEPLTKDAGAALLRALPDCLEHPDPALRDSYAFTTLSAILRAGQQEPETVRELMLALLDRLSRADEDPDGFRGPFAILALAEVARVDRLSPFLSEEERGELVTAGKTYLATLQDYRGYSETDGWRHGVAHGADLLMQLSLNSRLTKPQAEDILAAVASKVGTPDHSYIFGEDERLAMPVLFLARRGVFSHEEWTAWFSALWPADDPLRTSAYVSEAALARRHNLRLFAETLYVNAAASDDEAYAPLQEMAFALLVSLP